MRSGHVVFDGKRVTASTGEFNHEDRRRWCLLSLLVANKPNMV
jgi:hypothetical protein